MKATIAACVGNICASRGKPFDPSMADSWLVNLEDDEPLEPYLPQATKDSLRYDDFTTLHTVYERAVELLKESRKKASRPAAPALPPPAPERLTEHRTKMHEAFLKATEQMREKMTMPKEQAIVDDPDHLRKVREQVAAARNSLQ